jgi:hypothetical protein
MLTLADVDWEAERTRRQNSYYADIERQANEPFARLEPLAGPSRENFRESTDAIATYLSTKATERRTIKSGNHPSFNFEDRTQSDIATYESDPAILIQVGTTRGFDIV